MNLVNRRTVKDFVTWQSEVNGLKNRTIKDNLSTLRVYWIWSCHAYVPVSQLIYAAFRSNAKGLLPPSDEWPRRGLENPLIFWNISPSAWRLVSQRLRQISSALIDLKNVSTIELWQQLPLPLIETLKPYFDRRCWYSLEQYCHPRSVW